MSSENVYSIGDLVSVVDNWWEAIDTQNIPAPLPLFDAQKEKALFGIIVEVELYPGTKKYVKDTQADPFRARNHGLYHVLLSTGKVKKYFQNRLDKINLEGEEV